MTAREAADAARARLARHDDPAMLVSVVPDDVLDALVATIDAGDPEGGPLAGTTFTVKDNIDVAGCRTTAGCPSFGGIAEASATVVERLVAAGAVPIAKTNLDQFATGLVGTRSPYGTPRNPFDPALVPGGSSSGAAVSVATGLVDVALGTDTAGSGRVPAAMCGIVGLKPTRGWLSTAGVLPAVRSIDCVSVFARDVLTAWRATVAASGPDPLDPLSREVPPTSRAAVRTAGVVTAAQLRSLGVDDRILAGYGAACAALASFDVRLVEVDITPLLEIGGLLYGGPWVAERYVSVGDFVTAGHDGLDPVVAAIIGESAHWSATDVYRAEVRLAALRHQVDALFATVDLLVTPTVPVWPTVAEVRAEPRAVNTLLGTFTTFTNLADLCALSVPHGEPCGDGTLPPVSITFHGPAWSDEMLVHAARVLAGGAPDADAATVPRGWITLAVAGAHLRGLPLEWQLRDRGAVWLGTTSTAPAYELHALAATVPPKPGLVRVGPSGSAIEVDVWALAPAAFGDFVAQVPAPLCIGTVELADGTTTSGFLCEPRALDGAEDITALGSWRAHVSRSAPTPLPTDAPTVL